MNKLLALPLLLAAALSAPAQAADLDDLQTEEQQSTFCQSLWRLAKNVATERDKGTDEDTLLERMEAGFERSSLGYKAKHVMRTTVKGAYVQSELSPSRYAADTQRACMDSFKRR